jgi:hypothetical protein
VNCRTSSGVILDTPAEENPVADDLGVRSTERDDLHTSTEPAAPTAAPMVAHDTETAPRFYWRIAHAC